jgi:hypothetical protein
MAAEYLANAVQDVSLNSPVLFTASIPCTRGYIYHEDESGIFILRGIVNNSCAKYATYQVTFNANIAVPTGGTVGAIAVAITVNGEAKPTSKAIVTPAAVEEFNNVTSTCIIKVPRGCCFSVSVRYVSGVEAAGTPSTAIEVQNANFVINRIA